MKMEQEETQFLQLFDIYKEAFKLIFKRWKIFTQITLALILPLSFIIIANERISDIFDDKIFTNKFDQSETTPGTPTYRKLSDLVSSLWTEYMLFKAVYFAFFLALSLLSTSAVVYTIACAYTSRETTFGTVMSVVTKVWKRLAVTFLCAFSAFFAYNKVSGVIYAVVGHPIEQQDTVCLIMLVLYAIGFVSLTIIWQLATVVSALEESYGIKAVIKSMRLIKGRMFLAAAMFFKLNLFLFMIYFKVVRVYVVCGFARMGILQLLGFGALYLLLLSKMILFILVVQTVVYFFLKSYHRENVDESALADHLEVCLGNYAPLTTKDVQVEENHV